MAAPTRPSDMNAITVVPPRDALRARAVPGHLCWLSRDTCVGRAGTLVLTAEKMLYFSSFY